MKARVKATGDIVDVAYSHTSGDGVKYYGIDKSVYMMMEDELDFDFSYSPDYWTHLEHQAAIAAMQGILAHEGAGTEFRNYLLQEAMGIAHALVEKLKSEEK